MLHNAIGTPFAGIYFGPDFRRGGGVSPQALTVEGKDTHIGADGLVHYEVPKGASVYANGGLGTALCVSKVSLVNGKEGRLTYRGYLIENLAADSNFMDVSYLLKKGELPTPEESVAWKENILNKMVPDLKVQEKIIAAFNAMEEDMVPMDMLQAVIPMLPSKLYGKGETPSVSQQQEDLLALMPALVALAYRRSEGQALNSVFQVNNITDYSTAFLKMMLGGDNPNEHDVDPVVAQMLDKLLVVHGDHDQNCSTTALRTVTSSHNERVEQYGFFRAVSAGAGALNGSKHGKANQDVLNGLRAIEARVTAGEKLDDVIAELIQRASDRSVDFRLPGVGHRVYDGVLDPRAGVISELTPEFLKAIGVSGGLFDIAVKIHEAVSNNEYFVKRGLQPNVDFFSGINYTAMGIPEKMLVPMFLLGRLAGWCAHYDEQIAVSPIMRPGQVYAGEDVRFLPEFYQQKVA